LLLTDLAMAANKFTPDSQPTGWLSKPDTTFFDLSSGTEIFYQLAFFKDTWSGNVKALDINSTARVQNTGPWDSADPTLTTAASLLEYANFSADRKIATFGRPFRWINLTADEQKQIGSEDIVNFVRGDRSNDEPYGLSLRKREFVLGDILHSNIIYWDDGTNQNLYVGSNDGMLHAFNANTGVENFAYIPSMLIPKLNLLAEKPYVHTHFVDGPINIANIEISGRLKTILVGGLGAGGQGLFALDITDPTVASEFDAVSKAMWEIAATDSFADLGYTYGTPLFTRLANGTPAVIIGNGYMSKNGRAVLYIINANTGALISAIDTGTGSKNSPNGLSSPALFDVEGDAIPEYVYAGDLDGQLWKFDLSRNTSSLVLTTSPIQAITTAPVVMAHPLGGQMIAFATGRMLSSGDKKDTSVHYAYGVWDGAPAGNDRLLTQTLFSSTFNDVPVRSISGNTPDWSAGSGHHKGWRVALEPGERVVGEKPFHNNGRFYFLTTNPTVPGSENWIHELVFNSGGAPLAPIFDLNGDGSFDNSDLAANGGIPVGKYLGPGIFSQPRLVNALELTTTLYVFHPDLPIEGGVPTPPPDPGVSAGHFDFDIYYYGDEETETVTMPTGDGETATICKKNKDVSRELDKITTLCEGNANISDGYTFLTDYVEGSICRDHRDPKKMEYWHTITCNTVTEVAVTSASYLKVKHVHEYDDKYDVTGVNMLNASLTDFNLSNALAETTPFKVLVMNQYINPAAFLSVGGNNYESVKTYGGLASATSASALLGGLPTYTRGNIGTLIFNLPLDAFKNKDWWGDGGERRAGLIPTQTGCVNAVNDDGSMKNDRRKGIPGPNGERFNGSLTIQLIKPDTPASALELNGPDVTYGWRVMQAYFTDYVLAEYTSFWHHPNHHCYGEDNWVPDPPEDFDNKDKVEEAAVGSADPRDGAFGAGIAIVSVDVSISDDGTTTTTVTTYSDGTEYLKIETRNEDGTTTIYQRFRDGTEETVISYSGRGGQAGYIDPNTGSPEEELGTGEQGRQSWRDIIN